MKIYIFLTLTLLVLSAVSTKVANASAPFDVSLKVNNNTSYTLPGLEMISFSNQEFMKVNTGYVHRGNWVFSTMTWEGMGTNLTPYHWDAQPSVSSYYLHLADAGYRFIWPSFTLILGLQAGMLHRGDVLGPDGRYLDSQEENYFSLGFLIAARWRIWRFDLQLETSVASTDFNVIGSTSFSMTYRLNKKWQIGLISENASREIELCTEGENCNYSYSLGYTALFVARRISSRLFLRLGIVISSWMDIGYRETTYSFTRDFKSIYISIN